MPYDLAKIASQFDAPGTFQSAEPCGNGHINDTFKVSLSDAGKVLRVVLQRINHAVFIEPIALMENMRRVTEHIANKPRSNPRQRTIKIYGTLANQDYHKDTEGNFWRMISFIDGASAIEQNQTEQHIFEAAHGFGLFLGQLADLPGKPLHETIPNFHDGTRRVEAFVAACENNSCDRMREAAAEVQFMQDHAEILKAPQRLIADGTLIERATHNDAKISNVLLDDETGEAVCVIDLDTTMPGLAMVDFGDLVRTTVSGMSEDEPDLAKVVAQPSRFEAAYRGYTSGAAGQLTENELKSLSDGPVYMTLIMAIRFLTDFLQGDTYYKISHRTHNLQRCQTQIALAQSLIENDAVFCRTKGR